MDSALEKRELDWNFYSLTLIGLILLLQIFRSYQYPQFLDAYFHLHRAWSLEYWKGFSCVDLLQNAPIGRPNLYPPFYHSLIHLLHSMGMEWITISKIFSVLIVPVFCLVFYFIFRDLVSDVFGFIFVLLVFSNYGFLNSLINNIPATISIIFWGLSFYCFIKNRYMTSALVLGLCFYTHPVLGYLEFGIIFIWALLCKKSKVVYYLFSLVIASPFIFHQLYNIKYFSSRELLYGNWFMEFKFVEIGLCIAGIIMALTFKDNRAMIKLFLLSLIAGTFFSMLSGYRDRVIVSQGFLPVIFFAAYCIYSILKKIPSQRKRASFLIGIFIFFILFSPSFLCSKEEKRFVLFDSFFVNSLKDVFSQRVHGFCIWSEKEYMPVVEIIKNTTNENDVIYSNMPSLAVMFSFLSERPTASALFTEAKPFSDFDEVSISTLVIHLKDLNESKDLQTLNYFSQRDFKLVKDLPIFYIFKNPKPQKIKKVGQQFIVNIKLLYCCWIILFCSIIFSYVRESIVIKKHSVIE